MSGKKLYYSDTRTLMLGGNLNLSITMTALSTFSAFFMIPLWIFTLGKVIFDETDIVIPYHKLVVYPFCLVVPLGIGLLIAR
jgi:sodium/bile acid cotransporter 3/5